MIARRHMKTPFTPIQGFLQPRAVAQIAFDGLEDRAFQAPHIGSRAQQRFDAMPLRDQLMDQIRSDEPRGARDEAIHALMILQPRVGSTSFSMLLDLPRPVSVI